MNTTCKVTTDLVRKSVVPMIHAVQGDCNTREIEVEIFSDGAPFQIPAGAAVSLRYKKPDHTGGIYDTLPDDTKAFSVDGNVVTFQVAPQVIAVPGVVLLQLEIVNGEEILATFTFKIRVEADPSVGVMESEGYVNLHQWASDELEAKYNELLAYHQQMADNGEFDAEGYTHLGNRDFDTVMDTLIVEGKYRFTDGDFTYSVTVERPDDTTIGQSYWTNGDGFIHTNYRDGHTTDGGTTWVFDDWTSYLTAAGAYDLFAEKEHKHYKEITENDFAFWISEYREGSSRVFDTTDSKYYIVDQWHHGTIYVQRYFEASSPESVYSRVGESSNGAVSWGDWSSGGGSAQNFWLCPGARSSEALMDSIDITYLVGSKAPSVETVLPGDIVLCKDGGILYVKSVFTMSGTTYVIPTSGKDGLTDDAALRLGGSVMASVPDMDSATQVLADVEKELKTTSVLLYTGKKLALIAGEFATVTIDGVDYTSRIKSCSYSMAQEAVAIGNRSLASVTGGISDPVDTGEPFLLVQYTLSPSFGYELVCFVKEELAGGHKVSVSAVTAKNVEAFEAPCLVLNSSTAGSSKKYAITIDDTGTFHVADIT